MVLEILTFDEVGEEKWVTGNVKPSAINAAYPIPNEKRVVNIIISGIQLTVIETRDLHELVKTL